MKTQGRLTRVESLSELKAHQECYIKDERFGVVQTIKLRGWRGKYSDIPEAYKSDVAQLLRYHLNNNRLHKRQES